MKYRSKTDIIGSILEAVKSADNDNNALSKSKIMYTVFLSYAQLQENLLVLVENGLIEKYQKGLKEEGKENKENKRSSYYYRITDKGRRFLQIYRELNQMIMIA
jgi:predicted transcriptional regulator